ncbi:MAG: beta-propeller fold lactonase family protein [Gemmatimonadota bacterium]
MRLRLLLLSTAALAAACDNSNPISDTGPDPTFQQSVIQASATTYLYTETNEVGGNRILAFPVAGDGSLGSPASYPTGGTGTGGGLGNQGAVAVTKAGDYVVAVNAGSNDVSLFKVSAAGLQLVDREPSGGSQPISVSTRGDIVVVLNAGGTGNIVGFVLEPQGNLRAVPGFTAPLSTNASGPAQVSITPGGHQVVVTEKAANVISTYALEGWTLGAPLANPSKGMTPFGFAFHRGGALVVSEAFGGAAGAAAVSSYRLAEPGLKVVSRSVPDHQGAACWVALTPDGRFVYTTNTGSGNVSTYSIDPLGRLELVTAATPSGQTPIDALVTADGRFLYVLNSGSHTISVFSIGGDGSLSLTSTAGGIPAGSSGLAAL